MNMMVNKTATSGGALGVSSAFFTRRAIYRTTSSNLHMLMVSKPMTLRKCVSCSAVQESSTSTVATENKKQEANAVETKAPARPKPAAKAPPKPLPQLMEEDVLPSLKATLEDEEDITQLELSFQDNRLEGSFLKLISEEGQTLLLLGFFSQWSAHSFHDWTGPKGFSISSYGSEASTVEPFLIDEKRITGKHIVFWVRKRLAAQGIIPVWDK